MDTAMIRRLRPWRSAWQQPDDPLAVMAEHRDAKGTCQRCTGLGVGSHGEQVPWPCGAYLTARGQAHRRGLELPEDGLDTTEPSD
jgi:hypothetical protein